MGIEDMDRFMIVTYLTPHGCSKIREVVSKKDGGRRSYKKRIVDTGKIETRDRVSVLAFCVVEFVTF